MEQIMILTFQIVDSFLGSKCFINIFAIKYLIQLVQSRFSTSHSVTCGLKCVKMEISLTYS